MKNVKQTLLDRRSIRRYEREPITEEQMQFIYAAIQNTPTSYNGQQYSVIDVTDQHLKEQLYELTSQKQIKTCSHFMVFCADYHKLSPYGRRIDGSRHLLHRLHPHSRTGRSVGPAEATRARGHSVRPGHRRATRDA